MAIKDLGKRGVEFEEPMICGHAEPDSNENCRKLLGEAPPGRCLEWPGAYRDRRAVHIRTVFL